MSQEESDDPAPLLFYTPLNQKIHPKSVNKD